MSHTDIHILVTTSPNYEHIYKYFKESLQNIKLCNNLSIHVNIIDMSAFNNNYSFRSDGWYYACREKTRFLYNFMMEHPDITYILQSDADIHFLNSDKLHILFNDIQNNKNIDFYGMRENTSDEFNGGFFIIKNVSNTQQFIKHIIDELEVNKPEFADQTILNQLLLEDNKYSINYEFIPMKYYVWGDGEPCNDTIFHHAVATRDKVAQIENVKRKYISIINSKKKRYHIPKYKSILQKMNIRTR